jgi:hypothetical protein
MRGVREERFKELEYHKEASIRYERVEASNSCVRTLIFGFFFFIVFLSSFFPAPFRFLTYHFIAFSSFSIWFFIALCFSPFFVLVLSLFFLAHLVSSLTYSNLLGNKMLGCCCSCCCLLFSQVLIKGLKWVLDVQTANDAILYNPLAGQSMEN